MFLRDFKNIDRPYHQVASTLTSGTAEILAHALAVTRLETDRFRTGLAPFGWPASLAEHIDVQPGPVRAQREGILLAFTWEALDGVSLFPRLDADLDLAQLGRDRTLLTLRGQVTLAPELLDGGTGEFLISRLAESMNRAFLEGVCACVEVKARPSPDRVP